MLAILFGSIQARLFVWLGRVGNQVGQWDRARSNKIIAADFVPVEQCKLDGEAVFVAPHVEEQFLIPCRVEAAQR